jgi:hypothetical protein
MAQGYVLERASVLAVLNLRLMAPDNWFLGHFEKILATKSQ